MNAQAPVATIAELIRAAGTAHADREAYWSLGVSLFYREILAHATTVTSWLRQAGLAQGDRVAIMLPNLLPYPAALCGALLGGYVVVNVNPLYTARELAFQLEDSGAPSATGGTHGRPRSSGRRTGRSGRRLVDAPQTSPSAGIADSRDNHRPFRRDQP